MRKILLTTVALLTTVLMMAAGNNSGNSKANAIDFDWAEVYEQQGAKWYHVDLSELDVVDPTLALYLTNKNDAPVTINADVVAKVRVEIPFAGVKESEITQTVDPMTVAAKDYKLWSMNVKDYMKMGVYELYLLINSGTQTVNISAKMLETDDIVDDACTSAKDFNWAGETVEAGETWYRLNLYEIKQANKELDFVVENKGTATAEVDFQLSLDCPATAIFGNNWTIAADEKMTEAFGRIFIDELNDDYVYLKLTTNQSLTLSVVEKQAPTQEEVEEGNKDFTFDDALPLLLDEENTLLANVPTTFDLELALLNAPRGMKAEFVIVNNSDQDANLNQKITFGEKYMPVEKNLVIPAGATVKKEMVNIAYATSNEFAYVCLTADQDLSVMMHYIVVNEDIVNEQPGTVTSTCETSKLLDWNAVTEQKAFVNQWYEIDINPLQANGEHLNLEFTNTTDSVVIVMGNIMMSCDSKDTIPYILPIPAGKTLGHVINYNLLALSPLEHAYVSVMVLPTSATSIKDFANVKSQADIMDMVSTNLDASVKLTAKAISAAVDGTACENGVTVDKAVRYDQAAGTTQWYRITDEMLYDLSHFPEISFMNNGSKAAHITLATAVSCDFATMTQTTITVPTWADFTLTVPSVFGKLLDKVLNEDVEEMYIKVTTDQPIAFGIDIDYGMAFGCDDAREFNWATGATIKAYDAQWQHFDITSVKQNKQQVRLTFANNADSIAWVAAAITLECPFRLALPMIFPVPANTSIDKWIDYSYFASTPVDELFVALYTDTDIQLTAVAESAVITPAEDCLNATEVLPNEKYTIQPGTSWYKFAYAPFEAINDKTPTLSFANESDKTATISMGATVGCEYGILTKGKVKVPANLSVTHSVPRWIFKAIRAFINDEVEHYYTQITTNQPLSFQIAMDAEVEPEVPETPEYVLVQDTVNFYTCAGDWYTNELTEETVFVDGEPIVLTKQDTIHVNEYLDTIRTYVVNPILPLEVTVEALAAIPGATPTFTIGQTPDVTGTIDAIINYYLENALPNVAKITLAEWDETTMTNVVTCETTGYPMTIYIEDECGNGLPYDLVFPVEPVEPTYHDVQNITECVSYTWDVNGETYTETTTDTYEVYDPTTGCLTDVYTLNLTINQPTKKVVTITECVSYTWEVNGQTYTESGNYEVVSTNEAGCEHIDSLYLTINKPTKTVVTETACVSYTWAVNGQTYTESGNYEVVSTNEAGCEHVDSLYLTINQPTKTVVTETACVSYTWAVNGQTYTESGNYEVVSTNEAGCEHVDSLYLTINKPTKTVTTESACAPYVWAVNGQTYTESGYYEVVSTNEAGCEHIDSLYLTIYNTSLPVVTENDLLAVCGEAVNVEAANAIINDHIATTEDYAPNAKVEWYQLDGTTWNTLSTTNIDGTLEEVTVKYAVATECGSTESEAYTLTVETPTPENNPNYTNIPLVSKYGGRILLIDLTYIVANFGWDVKESDVAWYQVVGDQPNVEVDTYLHDGYAHNEEDGSVIAGGKYYARIEHEAVSATDCGGEVQTTTLECASTQSAPQLLPNVVRPNETMRLVNLDDTTISTVKVVSTTGELLNTIQVNYDSEILINAAQQPGFYILEVSNANGKTSLRYIVK